MLPQWIIEKKRDGAELDTQDIRSFIAGYTDGSIPDYQMSALAMAIYFNGMSARETADLTVAMMESGKVIDPDRIPGIKVDKHSTGGIGDKISIPLAPLVASCGATVPMISGRGLGITGGTLDKLESIPGYRTGLSEEEFFQTLETCGCSMIGQTAEIAPADKKLYALRDVTATVPSIPLIVSSIMSKKMAEGID
ncbi:MAG: thymidine phosphorylase, partial [Verrucomicrobia bacterium]